MNLLERIEDTKKNRKLFLDLNNLGLKSIPRQISELNWLEILNLSNNRITEINNLSNLVSLRELDLSNNSLKKVSGLSDLNFLNRLYLNDNELIEFKTTDVFDYEKFEILNLSNNDIVILEHKIFDKDFLLDWGSLLRGNPLASPPLEVINQGSKATQTYLNSLDNVRPLNQAKVLLVGDGGSGKTSLLKNIFGLKFDTSEVQTHGINIQKKEYEIKGETILANFWDFGGQEIMHATHKFFLTERSIYLLVIDTRKEDKVEYWLKHIETFGGDSPILVIMNKVDQNPLFDVNRAFLQRKYKNIKGFIKLSCKTSDGIKELIKILKQELYSCETRITPFPRSWFSVLNHLNYMKDDFISYEQYYKICKGYKIINNSAQNTLLQFLHDLGIVLHFKNLKLHDTQVLNPAWLTNAVYRIINSEDIIKNNGVLEIPFLSTILNSKGKIVGVFKEKSSFLDVFKRNKYLNRKFSYPESKFLFLIQIMKEFDLCYKIREDCYIVPDLLPLEEKKLDFNFEDSLHVVFLYNFLPSSIFPKLMVKMKESGRLVDNLIWRTGFVIKDDIFKVMSTITLDKEENKINVWVRGEDNNRRREFLTFIRNSIKSINLLFDNLKLEELIPLKGFDSIYIDYQELLGYEEMGLEEFPVGKLRKKFMVSELLNGIEEKSSRKEISAKNDLSILILYHEYDESYNQMISRVLEPLFSFERIHGYSSALFLMENEERWGLMDSFNKAEVIIILLSEVFINSDGFKEFVDQAVLWHLVGDKKVIPILVDHCSWEDSFIVSVEPIFEAPLSSFNSKNDGLRILFDRIKNVIHFFRNRESNNKNKNEINYSLSQEMIMSLRKLISMSKTQEVIKILSTESEKNNNMERLNELILLSSEYQTLLKSQQTGLMSYEESFKRVNRINAALIKMIN